MDKRTKDDLLNFIGSGLEQVGDLATWIQSPQRRFHRHELFGLEIATLTVAGTNQIFTLRDIGYGGIGLVGEADESENSLKSGDEIVGKLCILGATQNFSITVRHIQALHIGCEFVDMKDEHHSFLKGYIQYMEASLHLRQADRDQVFPAFRGREWLSLIGHRGSLRFHIRRMEAPFRFDATMIFIMRGQHIFCSWHDNKVEIGLLNGEVLAVNDRQEVLKQAIGMLIGIRQGASLPDFAPVIQQAIDMYEQKPAKSK